MIRYAIVNDNTYCVQCFESIFAYTCSGCNNAIGIDSQVCLLLEFTCKSSAFCTRMFATRPDTGTNHALIAASVKSVCLREVFVALKTKSTAAIAMED